MAEKGAVMLLFMILLFIFSNFYVKRKCFITNGITFDYTFDIDSNVDGDESFILSSLFQLKRNIRLNLSNKTLLFFVLFLCGDIEMNPGPFTQGPTNIDCSMTGFKMFHLNIRGLQNNFDELREILLTNKIDIFGITETFLASESNFNMEIPGFTFIQRNRNSGLGGGVGAYIRDRINFVERDDLHTKSVESISIEVRQKRSKSFLVSFVYKPPSSSKHLNRDFDELFSQTLQKITDEKIESIFLGDFNTNFLNTTGRLPLRNIFIDFGYDQLITAPSRITKDTKTLIDLIFTNSPVNISRVNVISCSLSDHSMIMCVRKMNNIKFKSQTISFRDFSKYDVNQINNELLNTDFSLVYNTLSVNEAYNNLSSILLNVLNKHAPFVSKRIKGKVSPWLTGDVKQAMNNRDQLLRKAQKSNSDDDWNAYRRMKNFVTNLVTRAKRTFFKESLQESRSNPNKFWKIIKTIFPINSASKSTSKTFIIDEQFISEDKTIANCFCDFFSNISKKLKSRSFPLKSIVWNYFERSPATCPTQFTFTQVSDIEVLECLRKLKRKSATGIDQIPACFLKDIAYVLAKPLTHVINLSLHRGLFPNDLKRARIKPVHKSGNSKMFDNYRPISVLPVISKIFEKCVYRQLTKYLENNKMLSNSQHGFRSHRSTETATTLFIDTVRLNMDKGHYTGVIYIDLSKAFDTLNHSIMLNTLCNYGVTHSSNDWFADYLFSRTQQVLFQDELSSPCYLNSGVPQGSIIGPLLFILYINGLSDVIKHSELLMYADDTVLYCSAKTISTIEKNLQEDFSMISNWLNENELIINVKKGKTEIMIFGTSNKLKKLDSPPFNIDHNGEQIYHTTSYKYLGMMLTPNLNMTEYLTKSIKKASSRIRLLKKTRTFMDKQTAKLVYNCLVFPLFTYCSLSLYGPTPNYLKERIDKLEQKAEKLVGCGIPKREVVLKKKLCLFVHRCLYNNDIPESFEGYFEFKNTTMNTRNNGSMLKIPPIKLECARASFKYQGISLFNSLDKKLRMEQNFRTFKKNL